jgi:hypothetical protein
MLLEHSASESFHRNARDLRLAQSHAWQGFSSS